MERFRHVFGPVPSRRLGLSLGVDLVPHKTCPLDCVYCECGETTNLTMERREYVPLAEVKEELATVLGSVPKLDYVTFSGAGEPTLHAGIGDLVAWLKKNYPAYKICLLTNGVLLDDQQLVKELAFLDLIIPSLDAADAATFEKINRHHPSLTVEKCVAALAAFRASCPKVPFWLEIFIVPGVNDSPASIAEFKRAVARIRPDKIQLNTLDRPGSVDWIRAATPEEVEPFLAALRPLCPVEAVGKFKARENVAGQADAALSAGQHLLRILARRPCTLADLVHITNLDEKQLRKELDDLAAKGLVKTESQARGVFYRIA